MENILKELCKGDDIKEGRFRQYMQIKNRLSDKLRTVPIYFPHFSMHDASHSRNICNCSEPPIIQR